MRRRSTTRRTLKLTITCCSRQRCLRENHLLVRWAFTPRAVRKRKGGRDVAKALVALLVAVASALAGAQTLESPSGNSRPNQSVAFSGGAVTCLHPEVLRVPQGVIQRAKLKLRLMNLLQESLLDDAKGIVNIAREKEIRKLADKLKNGND
jgi:hypothetical protein